MLIKIIRRQQIQLSQYSSHWGIGQNLTNEWISSFFSTEWISGRRELFWGLFASWRAGSRSWEGRDPNLPQKAVAATNPIKKTQIHMKIQMQIEIQMQMQIQIQIQILMQIQILGRARYKALLINSMCPHLAQRFGRHSPTQNILCNYSLFFLHHISPMLLMGFV